MQRYYWTIGCRLLLGGVLFVLPLVLLMLALASRDRSRDVVGVAGGCFLVSVAGCTGLACIFLALSDLRNPFHHRLLAPLRSYGNPLEVARQIDAELAGIQDVLCIADQAPTPGRVAWWGLWVTPSWVVQVDDRHLAVARLADLEWVEEVGMPTEQNRRGPGFYQMGLAYGQRVVFRTTREEKFRLYLILIGRCPWILHSRSRLRTRTATVPASQAHPRGIQETVVEAW
jgi:hypothetical protein